MRTIKNDRMPGIKLRLLRQESDTWKRILEFMTEENIHLKNRLSEILKGDLEHDLLMTAEIFQNSFVREDELIRLLRKDVFAFDQLLAREIYEDGAIVNKVMKSFKVIRKNISESETQFNQLKYQFSNYLLEYTEMDESSVK
jgi:predicted metal-binding transcription factor (methanogenesis marker protein 9)